MKKINTFIIEDEVEQQELTKQYLERYSKETGECIFNITCHTSPMEFLESYHNEAELIFLDIRMPGINGMDVAREIRKRDSLVTIVFITSLAQYAIDGYSVQAEDYILKPISYSEFNLKLYRILKNVSSKNGKYMTIILNSGIVKLPYTSIVYLETAFHNVLIHDNDGVVHKKHISMKEVEEELKDACFLRINSSYLVNLDYAKQIDHDTLILFDGTQLKISRPRVSEVGRVFTEYKKS
jgi:two-component system, LytTR family, response regulator LytT